MGAVSSKQLESFTKKDVAMIVASYGEKFQPYAQIIQENGIDGELLASMTEQEFLETLDELDVTARLHRRKLLKEFRAGHETLSYGSKSMLISSCSSSSSSLGSSSVASSCLVMDEFNVKLAQQAVETISLRSNLKQLRSERSDSSLGLPYGRAAICLTDIENSTSLWEANPKLMRKSLVLHDRIIRTLIAENFGYEIDTEGDAFFLAFHEASDALNFAVRLQEDLNEAAWSKQLLSLPWAGDDGKGRRGLRVRVTIHYGAVETQKNPVTDRTEYIGPAMDIARSMEDMTMGGQILTSYETWKAASNVVGSHIESAQIINCGTYTIGKRQSETGLVSKRILEVAPASLAPLRSSPAK